MAAPAFTDRSAEQSRRFADYSGAGPAPAAADRAALPARDDVDAVLISVPIPHVYEVARYARALLDGGAIGRLHQTACGVHLDAESTTATARSSSTSPMPCGSECGRTGARPVPGAGPVPLWRPRGSTGLFDGLPGQRISSSASFAA